MYKLISHTFDGKSCKALLATLGRTALGSGMAKLVRLWQSGPERYTAAADASSNKKELKTKTDRPILMVLLSLLGS